MKLKFTASEGFTGYEEFTDGTVADVDDKRGAYLLATFGAHFTPVAAQKQVEEPPKNKAERAPKSNK